MAFWCSDSLDRNCFVSQIMVRGGKDMNAGDKTPNSRMSLVELVRLGIRI